jgi:hypothetical protein
MHMARSWSSATRGSRIDRLGKTTEKSGIEEIDDRELRRDRVSKLNRAPSPSHTLNNSGAKQFTKMGNLL